MSTLHWPIKNPGDAPACYGLYAVQHGSLAAVPKDQCAACRVRSACSVYSSELVQYRDWPHAKVSTVAFELRSVFGVPAQTVAALFNRTTTWVYAQGLLTTEIEDASPWLKIKRKRKEQAKF